MINPQKIVEYCQADKESLLGRNNEYRLIDNGSSVLVLAHTDTVFPVTAHKVVADSRRVYSPALDDRLGVYIALDLLPALGVVVDVLLTDGEESGNSTAELVPPEVLKKYNWFASLDRKGADVVTYGLDSPKFLDAIQREGFPIGQGSFSDISALNTDRCCLNLGIGYYHAHTPECYADRAVCASQVQRFARFYEKNKGIKFNQSGSGKEAMRRYGIR